MANKVKVHRDSIEMFWDDNIVWIEVKTLKGMGSKFQRNIERVRKNKLIESMKADGYWVSSPITVNQDFHVVDGQHRVLAALELGIEKVPAFVVNYGSEKDEAAHFSTLSDWNTKLKTKDYWAARKAHGDPVAEVIYALNQDLASLMHHDIQLKENVPGAGRKGQRWQITDALHFIKAGLGLKSPWARATHHTWSSAIKNIIDEEGKASIVGYVNLPVNFWNATFGTTRDASTKDIYTGTHVAAYCEFYSKLLMAGLLRTKHHWDSVISKMKTFNYSSPIYRSCHKRYDKLGFLVVHYNKGRTTRRIEL